MGSGVVSETSSYNCWEVTCPECGGSEEVDRKSVCFDCNGNGIGEMIVTYDDGHTKSGYYPKCSSCGGSGYLD